MMAVLGLILAIALALIHISASNWKFLEVIPRRRWKSLAGGVSIAYLFLDILPELSHSQTQLEDIDIPFLAFLEDHVYLLSFVGLTVFYGLESLALRSRTLNQQTKGRDWTSLEIFGLHIFSFAIYNAILGYLLQELAQQGLTASILFFIAFGLHFMVNDRSLSDHHKHLYDKYGRWLLAGSIVTGAVIGQAFVVHEAMIAAIYALIAGAIILNILKEELPEERESCFWSFVTGAIAYGVLIFLV
jgi:Mg2+/citrate symporter